ncbi:hypothetical protein GF314_17150, partial [bacterium]|nr:hypothetical protein [bacterium]
MPRPRPRVLVLYLFLTALAATAVALPPERRPSQFVHDRWTKEDGLPLDMVSAIAQTADGYLWMATQGGVVRFDGRDFVVFDALSDPAYPHKQAAVVTARGDSLWIGGSNGVALMHEGTIDCWDRGVDAPNGLVQSLLICRSGSIYAGTTGGLARLEGPSFQLVDGDHAVLGSEVRALMEDADGRVWVATRGGLAIASEGTWRHLDEGPWLNPEGVLGLAPHRSGGVWVATAVGLYRSDGTSLQPVPISGAEYPAGMIWSITAGPDGVLWIAAESRGFYRLHDGRLEPVEHGGVPIDAIHAFEDAAGSLWVGTFGSGLRRLRAGPFQCWGEPEGLSGDAVRVVAPSSDGGIWVATFAGGVDRIRDGRLRHYGLDAGLPTGHIGAIHEDRRGRAWVGASEGIAILGDDDRFHALDLPADLTHGGVRSIIEARDGAMWFGTRQRGVFRLDRDGTITRFTTDEGLLTDVVRGGLVELDDGTVLVGTDAGVNAIRDGRVTTIGPEVGVPHGLVLAMARDRRGDVWIGGVGIGLVRYRDGRGTVYGLADGLPDDAIFGILEDDRGRIWGASNGGVFSFRLDEFAAFSRGETPTLASRLFGRSDGLRNSECNGGCAPAVAADTTGRFWFATNGGVAMVHPGDVSSDPPRPPVILERVRLSGTVYRADESVVVPPGSGDLSFAYT